MALRAVAKVESHSTQPQNTPPEDARLPNEVLSIICSNINQLNDVHSLLLTNWQFNHWVSNDNLLWKGLVKSYFPSSFQEHENAPHFKDVFQSLQNRDRNINDYKFRTYTLAADEKERGVNYIDVQGDKFAACIDDGTVIVWDRNTRKILFELGLNHQLCFSCLVIKDDTLFAACGDGTITKWNINTGEKQHHWKGHQAWINFLGFRGNNLLSVAHDGKLKIWDSAGNIGSVVPLAAVAAVSAFAVHGDKVFVGLGTQIQVVDLNNVDKQGLYGGHTTCVHGLAVRGDHLFSCVGRGAIKMWKTTEVKFVRDITSNLADEDNKACGLIVKDNKIFCVLDDIAVLDRESGEKLYDLKSGEPTASACMQNGILISGSMDGTITIRDFNFPSLTTYDEQTLEKNLVCLDKSTGEDDPLCNELHPNFLKRLQEFTSIHRGIQNLANGNVGASGLQQAPPLAKQGMCKHMPDTASCEDEDADEASDQFLNHDVYKSPSFKEAVLRVKIEISLHLLLDRIHRGDQKRISELLGQPYWDELFLMDHQTAPLYDNVKKICLAEAAKRLEAYDEKKRALVSLKKKEHAVLKFLQYLNKH